MAFFTWNDSYSVGVKELDYQHQQLINMLNELYEAMQAQKASDILGSILMKLVNYTKTHFATEEKYFAQYGYPDTAAHKKEHVALTDQVLKFKEDFDGGRTTISVSLTSFLKNWLITHISGTDKKYGPYFNSKGLS